MSNPAISGSIRTFNGSDDFTYYVNVWKPAWNRGLRMSNRVISGSIRTGDGTEDFRCCACAWKPVWNRGFVCRIETYRSDTNWWWNQGFEILCECIEIWMDSRTWDVESSHIWFGTNWWWNRGLDILCEWMLTYTEPRTWNVESSHIRFDTNL